MRVTIAARVACAFLGAVLAAPSVAAQSSTVTATYSAVLAGSPTASNFEAGRVIAGFTDLAVTKCGRNPCEVRMNVPAGSAGSTTLRYVISAGPPALASCATLVPIAPFPVPPVIMTVPGGATATIRIYFCYDLTWIGSPPATFAPVVTFQLRNGA